jgi:hypothetical protein
MPGSDVLSLSKVMMAPNAVRSRIRFSIGEVYDGIFDKLAGVERIL